MPLAKYSEQGWPVGVWRNGAAEAEPSGALGDLLGLLGDDGLPFKRGGSTYKSNAAAGTGLGWVADATLPVGRRTIFTTAAGAAYYLNPADDATPVSLGAGGLLLTRPITVGGAFVVLSSGLGRWGGATSGPLYNTGTVSLTKGSRTVTGAGTAWLANVTPGSTIAIAAPSALGVVASVQSDTQLTLVNAWPSASVSGAGYSTAGTLTTSLSVAAAGATAAAVVANRGVYALGSKLLFSTVLWPMNFGTEDYHQFPAQIKAVAALRDTALVFTEAGVYSVANMAYELFDAAGNPQQRVDLVNGDLVAWSHEGIAPWSGALVVPALDGVYLMDATSAPQKISDPIGDLYLSYVRAGYKTGIAEVFNGHYLLPILNASNVWQDTLVCRLRPARGGGGPAWSRLSGVGTQVGGFAERSSSPPLLLGASTAAASRVLDSSGYFAPAAANRNDGDGTAVPFQMYTRAIPTGDNQGFNTVRRVELNYALADTGAPSITAEYQADESGSWTAMVAQMDGSADKSQTRFVWAVNKRCQLIRFRFTLSGAAASFQPKRLEMYVRPSQRQ